MEPSTLRILGHHPARKKHLEESYCGQFYVSSQARSERDCRRVRNIVVN
jgi:hypothetical protein